MRTSRSPPLAEDKKPEWLRQLVLEATSKGARIINDGGGAIHGSVFAPAVLFPASLASTVCQVEQFGPVLPIVPFTSDDEVLDWLIESPFGQQASLFGSEPEHLSRFIDPLANQVCRININSQCQRGPDSFPFTGRKDSAEGTLSISDALRVFSIRSLVAAKTTEEKRANHHRDCLGAALQLPQYRLHSVAWRPQSDRRRERERERNGYLSCSVDNLSLPGRNGSATGSAPTA